MVCSKPLSTLRVNQIYTGTYIIYWLSELRFLQLVKSGNVTIHSLYVAEGRKDRMKKYTILSSIACRCFAI